MLVTSMISKKVQDGIQKIHVQLLFLKQMLWMATEFGTAVLGAGLCLMSAFYKVMASLLHVVVIIILCCWCLVIINYLCSLSESYVFMWVVTAFQVS